MSKSHQLRRILRREDQQERQIAEQKQEAHRLRKAIENRDPNSGIPVDLPEEDALLTKRHARHARSMLSDGRRLGDTIDRLPIKPDGYHQKGARTPKSIAFEGPIEKLVEKYGPIEAMEHLSHGQLSKYDLRVIGDKVEIWDVRTGTQVFPLQSPLDGFRSCIRRMKQA